MLLGPYGLLMDSDPQYEKHFPNRNYNCYI